MKSIVTKQNKQFLGCNTNRKLYNTNRKYRIQIKNCTIQMEHYGTQMENIEYK
jgi:pectate lyase